MNTYGYVEANPINEYDVYGLASDSASSYPIPTPGWPTLVPWDFDAPFWPAWMTDKGDEEGCECNSLSSTSTPASPDPDDEENRWLSSLKSPAKRHFYNKINQRSVTKNTNTVIEPGINVSADIQAIRSGQAARYGNEFTINGRVYSQHNGTLYPVRGQGFYQLDRGAYKALQIYKKFGNTTRAESILRNMNVNPASRDAAFNVWFRCSKL